MSFFRGQMGRILAMALTAAWLPTIVVCADAQQMPAMHHLMPCCPCDAGSHECSAVECAQKAPKKTEAQSDEQTIKLLVADAVHPDAAVTPYAMELRELTPGLRFATKVFRLKDDLRI